MVSFHNLVMNAKYMIHQAKPKLVLRSALGYSHYILNRKPRLRYVDVIVHYGCNLKCEHCSCETLKDKSRRQLSPDDWGKVALQCEDLGALIYGVQGGEPLVYKDLEKVIHNLNPKRNFISLKTNGTIASEELFLKLKKMGVDSITVGFGPVPNEYDFEDYDLISRKLKNAFSLSLNTVRLISEAGIKPMMSVVISKQNINSKVFQGIIDIAQEHGVVLNCALAVPVGAWELNCDIMLEKKDRDALNLIMNKYPHVRTDFQSNWLTDGCGALKEKIYISPYGDILPCPFIHISFGNIFEEPLSRIWERGIRIRALAEYAPVCLAAEDEVFLSYLHIAQKKGKILPIRFDDPDILKLLDTTYSERISTRR